MFEYGVTQSQKTQGNNNFSLTSSVGIKNKISSKLVTASQKSG